MRQLKLLITLFAIGPVSAATITFEEFPAAFGYTEVESSGFTVAADGFFQIVDFGDKFLDMYATSTITVESVSGADFSISSLDIFQYAGKSVALTGFLSSGGTIENEVVATVTGESLITFNPSWRNLERFVVQLTASSGQTALDNIVVNVVPIPAAVWLFGSALLALGFSQRKSIAL